LRGRLREKRGLRGGRSKIMHPILYQTQAKIRGIPKMERGFPLKSLQEIFGRSRASLKLKSLVDSLGFADIPSKSISCILTENQLESLLLKWWDE
jgi:hypothetical protein